MSLRHPFDRVAPGRLHQWFVPLAAGTALMGGAMALALGPAEETLATLFALVTAGSAAEAEEIVARLSVPDRVRVAFLGGFDLLFGVLWTTTFAAACIWSARVFRSRALAALGAPLAWLAWLACLLDFPENLAYVAAVHGSSSDSLAAIGALAFHARIAAFFLLDAYVSLGVLSWIAQRRGTREIGLGRG